MSFAGINRNVSYLTVCNALCNTSTALEIAINALVGAMLAEDKSLATLPHAFRWVTTMLVSFPAAWTMRVLGRRRAFMVGAIFGIMGAAIGVGAIFMRSFWLFVVATIVMGIFNSFANFYRFAAAEAAEPAFRPKAISLVIGGGIVAAFVGPEIAKHTVDLFPPFTFAGTYLALVGVPIVLLVALLPINLPAPKIDTLSGAGRPMGEIMLQPRFIVAALAGMIGWGGMVLMMTATPLSMVACGFSFTDSASVIQWHIVGMFAPSFVTGSLIARYGRNRVLAAGVVLYVAAMVAGLTGVTLTNFLLTNLLIGIGWNFLFVGATDLLTTTYRPEERNRVQAVNDFLVFGMVAVASFVSGWLQYAHGWDAVNYLLVPTTVVMFAAIAWLATQRGPAPAV